MRLITSLSNPVIKSLRGLHERKQRRKSALFLAEGARVVTEALDLDWQPHHFIFLSGREDDTDVKRLIHRATAAGAEIIAVNQQVLAKISRKDNPQMVLASFAERWIEATALQSKEGCWVALEQVRDPGNLGTILRTADAVGAQGVILVGDCCDAWSVESVRASMGAIFNVGISHFSQPEFLEICANWHGTVIATTLSAEVDYKDASWKPPVLLLLGNEQSGLSQAMIDVASQRIRMPMRGRSDSLNLGVAAGVGLYEFLRNQPHN